MKNSGALRISDVRMRFFAKLKLGCNAFLQCLLLLCLFTTQTGCSKERQYNVSGQVFIVTKGKANIELALVGIHVLSSDELSKMACDAFERVRGVGESFEGSFFDRLPPAVTITDANGRFNLQSKGESWILARSQRHVISQTEAYYWIVPIKADSDNLLLSNHNLIEPESLRSYLATVPGVMDILVKQRAAADVRAAAEERAAADVKAELARAKALEDEVATEELAKKRAKVSVEAAAIRLKWVGAAMQRAGFDSNKISRTLTKGGTVVAWGDNTHKQAAVPAGLNGVVAIAAGNNHTVALKADGTVVAWGADGQQQSTIPPEFRKAGGVVAIAAGGDQSFAISDNNLIGWRDGGLYTQSSHSTVGYQNVFVAAGQEHVAILGSHGLVTVFGDTRRGQILVPSELSNVVAIAAGGYHTVALKDDGKLVAWGDNSYHQTTMSFVLNDVVAIAAGEYHTVVLRSGGKVLVRGKNTHKQAAVPAGLNGVVAIAAGNNHTVALKADGTVVAWGDNTHKQAAVPAGLNGVVAIAAGERHTVALKLD